MQSSRKQLVERWRRFTRRAGYTVVEVMMALSVLSIGATGVVAMQKVTLIGNTRARDLATATAIASSWVERLRYDGLRWTFSSVTNASTLASTTYLSQPQNVWFRPAGGGAFGATTEIESMTDVKGMDTIDDDESAFCVNIRLTPILNNPTLPAPIVSAMRADVRVYWLKVQHTTTDATLSGTLNGAPFCDPTAVTVASLDTVADGTPRYHFVYASSAIMRTDI